MNETIDNANGKMNTIYRNKNKSQEKNRHKADKKKDSANKTHNPSKFWSDCLMACARAHDHHDCRKSCSADSLLICGGHKICMGKLSIDRTSTE